MCENGNGSNEVFLYNDTEFTQSVQGGVRVSIDVVNGLPIVNDTSMAVDIGDQSELVKDQVEKCLLNHVPKAKDIFDK